MPGVGLSKSLNRKAPSDRSALKPYWGKLTVRNFREGLGNNGIIRSPFSAKTLLDRDHGRRTAVYRESDGITTGT
jgi:hypothetical protein